jgi:hypothetical protein
LATATKVTCPNSVSALCYRLNVGAPPTPPANPALSNGTSYTFDVQAENTVGPSDISDPNNSNTFLARATTTPSDNAAAQIVPNAGQTLTTCTTATSTQKTCVQYLIPSGGNGGVFGALGSSPLPGTFCGGQACFTSTGAQNVGALGGYNDRTHPLVEIITWDSTTLDPSLPLRPVCSTNSTATNCFPNNLPIFYETSLALLNPANLATRLNLPGATHFCSDSIAKGGAGNVNYARPKSAGVYTDTAGSACIKKISVLNGLPGRPSDKGDVQVMINLTSDSDALAGHH